MTPDCGCPGKFLFLRGHTAPLCFNCTRYDLMTEHMLEPAAMFDGKAWSCPNKAPILSSEQVRATDEMAQLNQQKG